VRIIVFILQFQNKVQNNFQLIWKGAYCFSHVFSSVLWYPLRFSGKIDVRHAQLSRYSFQCTHPVLPSVRGDQSYVFSVVFCRSLFVLFRLVIAFFFLLFTVSDNCFDIFHLFCTQLKYWVQIRIWSNNDLWKQNQQQFLGSKLRWRVGTYILQHIIVAVDKSSAGAVLIWNYITMLWQMNSRSFISNLRKAEILENNKSLWL